LHDLVFNSMYCVANYMLPLSRFEPATSRLHVRHSTTQPLAHLAKPGFLRLEPQQLSLILFGCCSDRPRMSVSALAADHSAHRRHHPFDSDDSVLLLRVWAVVRSVLGGGEREGHGLPAAAAAAATTTTTAASSLAPPGEQRLQRPRSIPTGRRRLRSFLLTFVTYLLRR